jgi:hypothetical protein
MSIENKKQLEATRQKLAWLEREYASAKDQPQTNTQVQDLTLRSFERMINQMKEEIARF